MAVVAGRSWTMKTGIRGSNHTASAAGMKLRETDYDLRTHAAKETGM